jgi:O-antigen/teichoic acid export membrane protein
MNLIKKIAFNTLVHSAGKFGASLIGVFIVAILTRYLGVDGYGEYTTIFAYLFFFAILTDLGLYVVTVNELGRSEFGEERFFNNIFSIRFFSALIFLTLASVLVFVFPYSGLIKLGVMVASVSIFLNLIDQIVVAFFQNKMNMKRVAVAELVGKLVTLGLTILVVYLGLGLLWVMVTIIVGFSFNLAINLVYLRRYIKLRFSFELNIWKKILKKSWPIAVTSVFSLIYFKADTLALSILPVNEMYAASREQAVGIYGAPYKILEVLIAWPAIFMGLVSPLLAKAVAEKKKIEFNVIFQKAFDILSIIIWPMIIGVLVLAKPLMVLIAGHAFAASGIPFQILIFAVGIIFLTHLTTYAIIALGKQKKMIKYYALAAVLALIGYLILIPKYSYLGAAGMTLGVELFMLIATLYLLKREILIKINLVVFGRAMLSAVVMGFMLTFLLNFNIILLIIAGAIVYLGLIWIFNGINKEMLSEFKK